MKTILLPLGTERVTVADLFRRMLALPQDGMLDVFTDSNDEIVEIRATGGGRPWGSEIQGEFRKFCQFKGVIPICAVTPWSNDYTGEGLQNGIYSISVDEFRMFAKPYEIEISCESELTPAAGKFEAVPVTQAGEPPMRPGKNSRKDVEAWVAWQASHMVEDGDNVSDIANKIYLIAERWSYQSERQKEGEKISVANIIKMIPAGLTGGRAKNTGKPKK